MRKIDLDLENSIFSHDLRLCGEIRLAVLVAALPGRVFVEFGLMVSVAERLFFNLEAKNVCQDEPRDSI